jgi:hydroxymethylglutaryl-CoA reductase
MTGPDEKRLPLDFRKLGLAARRAALISSYGGEEGLEVGDLLGADASLADSMVESAVGYLPVPLGVAAGFLVDGRSYDLPMAIEEPSVIAAAGFAARLVRSSGGFGTWATEPVMSAQVYLEEVPPGRELEIRRREIEIKADLDLFLDSMRRRGGGYRGLEVTRNDQTGLVLVRIRVDVRDAMGANVLDSAAEKVAGSLEAMSGGRRLMCVLTNDAGERRAGALFELPVRLLARGAFSGTEAARRLELASRAADTDPERAVTHNKGIMNGISALALATGNDTRALEAGAHYWAARDGRYRSLSEFRRAGSVLQGRIELPLALGSVGGSVGFHPVAALALRMLGNPDARTLSRIAAALGLAQNFAALFALVTEGIQAGHMKLHGRKREAGA